MARRNRRKGDGPPLDPFGANDPVWERYEGVSWARRFAQAHSSRRPGEPWRRRPRGELFAVMVAGALIFAVMIGIAFLLFWAGAALIRLTS
jgi:hypothetical protein